MTPVEQDRPTTAGRNDETPPTLAGSLLRFLLVGCSNFVVGYALFRLILAAPLRLTWKATAAQLVTYALVTFWSYHWNRRITFRSRAPVTGQALRFFLLQGFFAVTTSAAIGYGVDHRGFDATVVWFAVMAVATVANFVLCRRLVFR